MKLKPLLFILILAAGFTVTVLFHYSSGNGSDAQNREFSVLLAESVCDALDAELNGPIQVSLAMSQDIYVLNLLENENSLRDKDIEASFRRYLSAIIDKVGYSDAYIISDGSKRQYSDEGITRTINPTGDKDDVWYNLFADSGKSYTLNVDSSKESNNIWTIYIDTRISDSDGTFMGVCGVSLKMSELQQILSRYEKVYGVKISIVNEDGLVQADSDTINIESTYRKIDNLSQSEEFVYTKKGAKGYTVTKYLPDFNWYLVVKNDGQNLDTGSFDYRFLLISVAVLLGISALYYLFFKTVETSRVKTGDTQVDSLTGLWNRNYFKDVFGEHGIFNTTRYKTVAVFDIDSFKEANDTMDGDDIIRFVTECAKKHLGTRGEIFRWGGDEFMALMEWSMDFAEGIFHEMCHEIEEEGRVTISVGIATVRPSETIKSNYYRAVQGCYLVKEMGGNGVKVCDL